MVFGYRRASVRLGGDERIDEGEMIRTWLLAGSLLVVALPAAADVCVWNPKPAADKAVSLLTKGTIIMEFCPSCGDKMAKGTYVAGAFVEKIPDSTENEYFVKVNGDEIDLGHAFILGGRSKKD